MPNVISRQNTRNWFRPESRGSEGRGMTSMDRRQQESSVNSPVSYFGPLSNFFWDIDRMFDNTLRTFGLSAQTAMSGFGMQQFTPSVDIAVNDNEYTITCEVPGLDEKDISLDIAENGLLVISGEKRVENIENRRNILRSECNYGAFTRTVPLPEDANPDDIEAQFRNGVLTISCPRMESSRMQTRHIPIGRGTGGPRRMEEERAERAPVQPQGPRKAA